MQREKLISEAVRLNITVRDVKNLYRQIPTYKQPLPIPPSTYVKGGSKNAIVSGNQRHKFFDLPRISRVNGEGVFKKASIQYLNPQVNQQPQPSVEKKKKKKNPRKKMENVDMISFEKMVEKGGTRRTVGTQSMYRESEAQTVPYSHEIDKKSKLEQPEALKLTDLTYKNGLNPINKATLKEIDRVRRRKHVEQTLPMGRDKKSFEKRCKILKELELQEWMEREEKVAELQDKKFRKLRKQIQRGMLEIEERNQLRIDDLSKGIFKDLNKKLRKIELKRGKAMHKTLKKYSNPTKKRVKRDVIMDEIMKSSTLPGMVTHDVNVNPLERLRPTNIPSHFEQKPELLNDADALEKIEKKHVRKFQRKIQKRLKTNFDSENIYELDGTSGKIGTGKKRKLKSVIRMEKKIKNDIEFARKFKEFKEEKKKQNKNLLDLYRKTPRMYRPDTPVLEYDDSDDEFENSIITIQKLLRGRATQNKFCFAKEKALELIKELQMVEDVVTRERKLKKEKEHIKHEEEKKKKKNVNFIVDNIQGDVVSKYLDYLTKELIRQQQLQKLEVLKTNAEMQRVKREKIEYQRRNIELNQRKKQQHRYTQIMNNNKITINSYISDIFNDTIEKYSYSQSLKLVKSMLEEKKEKIEKKREIERKKNNSKETPIVDEEEVRDLVSMFLLPQIKREMLKKKVKVEQAKIIKGVHDAFYKGEIIEKVEKEVQKNQKENMEKEEKED